MSKFPFLFSLLWNKWLVVFVETLLLQWVGWLTNVLDFLLGSGLFVCVCAAAEN